LQDYLWLVKDLIFGLKPGFSRILDSLTVHFGGVHAFGYNSAESEPICTTLNTLSEAGPGRFWARSTQ